MSRSRTRLIPVGVLAITSLGMLRGATAADQPLPAQELRIQQVDSTRYFHVRFDNPAALHASRISAGPYAEGERRQLALTPRLVPQDEKTRAVCQRLELPHFRPAVQFQEWEKVLIEGLEFVGKIQDLGRARFLLLYPTAERDERPAGIGNKDLADLLRPVRWARVPVELDFRAARVLSAPKQGDRGPNLEKLWAEAQAARLALLEAQAPEFGFYGFACAATGRKYGVPDPALEGDREKTEEPIHRRMLDLTTGSQSITQSLALKRLRGAGPRAPVERTVDVARVLGIDIAEHPWRQMMGDRKPAPEPLAALVPRDNYYIRFTSFARFIEFQDLLDQWGTPAARAYEVQSREYGLKERYERQLCLKTTWLGRTLGPVAVKELAVTGHDPYLREGSDVTVLFHVHSRQGFLAGVEQFVQEARKEFAGRFKETKEDYHGIPVENFVTPLREVSLHRAAFDDFVVYSNSPVGLRRVLDTYQGRHESLGKALDFQYMRTVFRADAKEEGGFAFLSYAFIRQLVGPAARIKEMRRLEALTSLSMLTNGALFTAWETGKLPADHGDLLKKTYLKQEYLYVPEGKEARWDAERHVAVSDAYNTLHFATPLVELPLDRITPQEELTYQLFRADYLRLWRRYSDPVGMRIALDRKQAKLEVYVLPLINNHEYTELRSITGDDPFHFDPVGLSSRSLFQFTMSFSGFSTSFGRWALIRLDDRRALAQLGEWWISHDLVPPDPNRPIEEIARLVFQLPLTVGAGITDKTGFYEKSFPEGHNGFTRLIQAWWGTATVRELPYKGSVITRFTFGRESNLLKQLNERLAKGRLDKVVLYDAVVDDGWYIGFDEGALKDLIDRAEERKKKKPADVKTIPINASFHVSPRSAEQARAALHQYLEWETHKRALPNDALWYVLYRTGLVNDRMPERARREVALRFLGFVPVSPDRAPYRYDPESDEVINARHGSLGRPRLHADLAADSPVAGLLARFPSLRVDLRFREDGLYSVITVERK